MKSKSILLMRGLIREGRHQALLIPLLQKRLPDYHIHTIDIPGNGKWHQVKSFTTIRQNVNFLRDHWIKLHPQGAPQEATIVALSFGGMLALDWHQVYPQDFSKMMLVNTSIGGQSPVYYRLRPANLPALLKYTFTRDVKKRQEIIYDLTVVSQEQRHILIPNWVEVFNSAPVSRRNTLRQVWAAFKFRSSQNKPTIPTLVVSGRKDRLVDPRCSDQIAKHWQLPHWEHPNAGHDLSADDPKWLAEKIAQFVTENSHSVSSKVAR